MEDINYKKLDEDAIMAFLKNNEGDVKVASIITDSGANKLRVYNILFEMEQKGIIIVTQKSELGTPELVKLVR